MATYKTQGIVLRRHNLGEADRIITFLTPSHGKVRAVVRGVRKIGSRLAGHLELFSETELMLAEGRNLDVVASARLISFRDRLGGDFDRLSQAYLVAEMADKLTQEGETTEAIYRLVSRTLGALDGDSAPEGVMLVFKWRLLDLVGMRPELARCTVCRRALGEAKFFSFAHGGLVCSDCRTPGDEPLDDIQLGLITSSLAGKLPTGPVRSGHELCDRFYEYQLGLRFRAGNILWRT